MNRREMKLTVLALVRDRALARYEHYTPDLVVDDAPVSRATREWAATSPVGRAALAALAAENEARASARFADADAEFEVAVRRAVIAELRNLRLTGLRRLRLACASRYLPTDLRTWARRQLAKAEAAGPRAAWAVAYAVLVLRDAAEWETAHDGEAAAASALEEVQAEWVEAHTLEAGEYNGMDRNTAGEGRLHVVGEYRGVSTSRRVA